MAAPQFDCTPVNSCPNRPAAQGQHDPIHNYMVTRATLTLTLTLNSTLQLTLTLTIVPTVTLIRIETPTLTLPTHA